MSDPWFAIDINPTAVALQTTCVSQPSPYGSFNLGLHVGDDAAFVAENRDRLAGHLGHPVYFPEQVHGSDVLRVDADTDVQVADAVVTAELYRPIGILTADCLPVLFASNVLVGAAHAGWRGLVSGIVENTLAKFSHPADVSVWLGPCIGAAAFEVGPEVVDSFVSKHSHHSQYFQPVLGSDRSIGDLQAIAVDLLENLGVSVIKRIEACTYDEGERWYSYRRSGVTGRMASCIMRTE
jgi:YfiH family protein